MCRSIKVIVFMLCFGILNTKASAVVSAGGTLQTSVEEGPVVDRSLMNPSVSPCQDFYKYACGNWLDKTEIPGDRSSWFRFSEIDEKTLGILKQLLENYRKGHYVPEQKFARQLGMLYGTCMSPRKTDKKTQEDLHKKFEQIKKMKSLVELPIRVAQLHRDGYSALFGFFAAKDMGDASQVIGNLAQGGMGLPDKSYYTDENAENSAIKKQYLEHIQKMLVLVGFPTQKANEASHLILEFETNLARHSLSADEQRDPKALYHPLRPEELKLYGHLFDWGLYFQEVGAIQSNKINVVEPVYFHELNKTLSRTKLDTIKVYLIWQIVHGIAEYSTESLFKENFSFYGKILNGQKEPQVLWKRCVGTVDSLMGEALGEAFIKKAFSPEAKSYTQNMMKAVRSSFANSLNELTWMDAKTKEGALEKLNSLVEKVGYPDQFEDYSDLKISEESYYQNAIEGNRFAFQKSIAKIGKPIERGEWEMTPPTNNAYYSPLMNEIVFPAGILQAPLFSLKSNLAANMGATGATIGHEITHGFDDEGRQYDSVGNLKDWWSQDVSATFQDKTKCLISQYNQYEVVPGVKLKGDLTLGENIADLGGLKIALKALISLGVADEASLQTFFISYAQSWCGKTTPERAKRLATMDPHSPPQYRVNGVVVNLPEFAKVFRCSEGAPMAPKNRCEIW